eukprot:GDKI01032430.1.p2 GENE.GDKI01032430.1~~GDKI01032430.1.p2  ORF type:complete len:157 (+),score=56.65 GDKI01032430.1:107-577(+)
MTTPGPFVMSGLHEKLQQDATLFDAELQTVLSAWSKPFRAKRQVEFDHAAVRWSVQQLYYSKPSYNPLPDPNMLCDVVLFADYYQIAELKKLADNLLQPQIPSMPLLQLAMNLQKLSRLSGVSSTLILIANVRENFAKLIQKDSESRQHLLNLPAC